MQGPEVVLRIPTPAMPTAALLTRAGRVAAAVCADRKLRLWDRDARLAHTVDLGREAIDVSGVSSDGRWVVTGDHAGAVVVWNAATGEAHMNLKMPPYAGKAAFSHDGGRIALSPAGGAVQVFEIETRRKLFELEPAIGGANVIAFSRDGALIATANADTTIFIHDASSGRRIAANTDFLAEPLGIDFTADGKQVIAGGADKVIAFIDAASGKALRRMDRVANPLFRLGVSEDGRLFAGVFLNADNLRPAPMLVWDTASGRKQTEWMPAGRPIGGAWTDDGRLLVATAADDAITLWRVQ
jgi:WD40 repeat protein